MTTTLTKEQINKGLENASKIALIGKAAQAIADCCTENEVDLETALPMILELAKRKINQQSQS